MSADKRTVATDALETLGMKIGQNEKRDAIHLAVEPVIAGETLKAGQHIGLRDGKAYLEYNLDENQKPLGIVDPFLAEPVNKGEKFWLIVYPRKITSLRHVWSHPAFPEVSDLAHDEPIRIQAEQWLKDFCESHDMPDYETVMKAIRDEPLSDDGEVSVRKDGDYWTFINTDAHCDVPVEFWEHVEIVLGRKLRAGERTDYFGCSC